MSLPEAVDVRRAVARGAFAGAVARDEHGRPVDCRRPTPGRVLPGPARCLAARRHALQRQQTLAAR